MSCYKTSRRHSVKNMTRLLEKKFFENKAAYWT